MRFRIQLVPLVLASLVLLQPHATLAQPAPTTAPTTNKVADVLDLLKSNPSDINLLIRLQNAIKTDQDQQEKTRGLAAYALGCLIMGKNQAAQQGVDYLRKNYPASPYITQVSFDNLSKPCPSCNGNGSVDKPCPRCKGSGTCISCNGAGSLQGITGPLRCAGCTGTGKCRECNGTGTVRQRCTQCAGNGTLFDRSKAQAAYTSILREKEVAEQQRQEAERLRQQTAAQEAAARARQAEEERKLLEARREQAAWETQQAQDRAAAGVSDLSWSEIDGIYNIQSGYTDLQKDEIWKKYKGKTVEWQGEVSHVAETFGTLSLQIKMNSDTFTSDLLINLRPDQRQRALSVKEGQYVSFRGTLDEWGSVMPITLKNGQLIVRGSPRSESTVAPRSATPISQDRRLPHTPTPAPAGISWAEINAIYNLQSGYTDLQKKDAWPRYRGKRVQWQGAVSHVAEVFGDLSLQIKMNPETFTSDLLITLRKDQRQKALSVREGQTITFRGILDDWGSLTPITLKDGEIVLDGSQLPSSTTQESSVEPSTYTTSSSEPRSQTLGSGKASDYWYLILYGLCALWVFMDAIKRKNNVIGWPFGTLILGPLLLPIYLSQRNLKAGETREGGRGWCAVKYFALFWTLTMGAAGLVAMFTAGKAMQELSSQAEQAGAAIGTTIGLGLMFGLWLIVLIAALIVGLFLKRSGHVEKGPTGALAPKSA